MPKPEGVVPLDFQSQKKFDFNNLFTFEMANNHQGSVEHGKRIINAIAEIAERMGVRAAIKFQFRDLDTLIHPDHRTKSNNKHISRFLSTELKEEDFAVLVHEAECRGLITMATPFDEPSVDRLVRLNVAVAKIASCSALDWPLLERVAEIGKPVICSTGGLTISEIDRIVSFFQHRGIHFALMHCVAMYPTPNGKLHLNQIELMRNRYPGIVIGFSTHEDPANTSAVKLAYAKGARLFEKHVGVPTETIVLNAYSANPTQVEAWLAAWREAVDACGGDEEREISSVELVDLHSLRRGVYLKKAVRQGTSLKRSDVFFAMPLAGGQLSSGSWKEKLIADRDYEAGASIADVVLPQERSKKEIIYSVIHAVKGMLNMNKIPLGHDFLVELSHHYGIERFHEVGCTLIECINREYAKKLIIQLPGQMNPVHYHKKKDETFQLLTGELEVEIDGRRRTLYPGDTLWVPRGVWHGFRTSIGAIFEEVSTASFNDDSFYLDKAIANMARDGRKTNLYNWGRHQFDEFDAAGNVVNQYL